MVTNPIIYQNEGCKTEANMETNEADEESNKTNTNENKELWKMHEHH